MEKQWALQLLLSPCPPHLCAALSHHISRKSEIRFPFHSDKIRRCHFRQSYVTCKRESRSVCFGWRWTNEENELVSDKPTVSFAEGVKLFNAGEYYRCHDIFESLWNTAAEPQRSLIHGLLQCAVALHHLLNHNHRGAMVELGEGLSKLRRQKFKMGPFREFEYEASALLEFLYNTQLEHAACADNVCVAMDGSEQSYQLLGDFAAGKRLYGFYRRDDGGPVYMEFISSTQTNLDSPSPLSPPLIVKLPELQASEDDLYAFESAI